MNEGSGDEIANSTGLSSPSRLGSSTGPDDDDPEWAEGVAFKGCSQADVTTQGDGPSDPLFGVPDGLVTGADPSFFVNDWVAGSPASDLTALGAGIGDPQYGVPDSLVTGADILYLVNLWIAGCP